MTLSEKLQAAIDATTELARAARTGATVDKLDELAGLAVQKMAAFRGALRRDVVHRRTQCTEMGYDGPACLGEGGKLTDKPELVTCPKCRKS